MLTVWKVSSPDTGVICSNKYFSYVFIVLLLPVHRGAVFQWSLSWLKQFIFSARHSFSSFAFFFSFRSFFFSRSSLIFRRASFAISFSSRLESLKFINDILYFPAHKTHVEFRSHFSGKKVRLMGKLVNTRTSIIQHFYREIVKFASQSWDLASMLVNSLLPYPGIYPNIYIASHVILGIYAAAVAKCSQV